MQLKLCDFGSAKVLQKGICTFTTEVKQIHPIYAPGTIVLLSWSLDLLTTLLWSMYGQRVLNIHLS